MFWRMIWGKEISVGKRWKLIPWPLLTNRESFEHPTAQQYTVMANRGSKRYQSTQSEQWLLSKMELYLYQEVDARPENFCYIDEKKLQKKHCQLRNEHDVPCKTSLFWNITVISVEWNVQSTLTCLHSTNFTAEYSTINFRADKK